MKAYTIRLPVHEFPYNGSTKLWRSLIIDVSRMIKKQYDEQRKEAVLKGFLLLVYKKHTSSLAISFLLHACAGKNEAYQLQRTFYSQDYLL